MNSTINKLPFWQAVQRSGICLTLFGQEANATHLVSKCIGNAETCSRAKHAAAGIRHAQQ